MVWKLANLTLLYYIGISMDFANSPAHNMERVEHFLFLAVYRFGVCKWGFLDFFCHNTKLNIKSRLPTCCFISFHWKCPESKVAFGFLRLVFLQHIKANILTFSGTSKMSVSVKQQMGVGFICQRNGQNASAQLI